MKDRKVGMAFDDVRVRVLGPLGKDKRIRESLLNQTRLCEGEEAKTELEREISHKSSFFSGAGNKQTGWGKGKKLGDGKWRWTNGSWVRMGM